MACRQNTVTGVCERAASERDAARLINGRHSENDEHSGNDEQAGMHTGIAKIDDVAKRLAGATGDAATTASRFTAMLRNDGPKCVPSSAVDRDAAADMQRAVAAYAGPVTRVPPGKRGQQMRPGKRDDADAGRALAKAGKAGAFAKDLGTSAAVGEAAGVTLVRDGAAVPTRINKFLAKKHVGKSVPVGIERDDERRFARVHYRADEPRFVDAWRAGRADALAVADIRPYTGTVLPKAKRPLSLAERVAKARRKRKLIARKQRAANQAHKRRQAAMRGATT
jgi:hypothetical protein